MTNGQKNANGNNRTFGESLEKFKKSINEFGIPYKIDRENEVVYLKEWSIEQTDTVTEMYVASLESGFQPKRADSEHWVRYEFKGEKLFQI